MVEQNKNFPEDIDVAREEEEVRDLFHQLIENVVAEADVQPNVVPEEPVETKQPEETDEPEDDMCLSGVLISEDSESVEFEDEDVQEELPPLILAHLEDDDEEEMGQNDDYYSHFVFPEGDEEEKENVQDAPREKRNPFAAFWHALCDNVPLPCDSLREILRKSLFWLAIVVLAGALTYILYNVWWLPTFTKDMYAGVQGDYHPEAIGTVEDSAEYPKKMQLSFQMLYDRNNEVRGWLSYHAAGQQDFLNIEYPIMYSGDNEKYLTIDFNGNKNKNGALFFDERSNLQSAEDTNTALIVYGHNMASGQMLAGLNKFIGNVNNARVAPTLTMNTLFSNGEYKVFAVVMTDEIAENRYYFNVRRLSFLDVEDFDGYIAQLRERSLFDYPVDVQAGDELLLLSTCTVESSSKLKDGRLTVIARKVRPGEEDGVDTTAIIKNEDVIMPYAWYTAQEMDVHAYYTTLEALPDESTTTTGTGTGTGDDTSASLPDGSTSASDPTASTTTVTPSASTSVSSSASTSVSGSGTTASTTESTATSTTSTSATASTESTASTTESTTTSTESTTVSTTESTTASTTEADAQD